MSFGSRVPRKGRERQINHAERHTQASTIVNGAVMATVCIPVRCPAVAMTNPKRKPNGIQAAT